MTVHSQWCIIVDHAGKEQTIKKQKRIWVHIRFCYTKKNKIRIKGIRRVNHHLLHLLRHY